MSRSSSLKRFHSHQGVHLCRVTGVWPSVAWRKGGHTHTHTDKTMNSVPTVDRLLSFLISASDTALTVSVLFSQMPKSTDAPAEEPDLDWCSSISAAVRRGALPSLMSFRRHLMWCSCLYDLHAKVFWPQTEVLKVPSQETYFNSLFGAKFSDKCEIIMQPHGTKIFQQH